MVCCPTMELGLPDESKTCMINFELAVVLGEGGKGDSIVTLRFVRTSVVVVI